MAASSAFQSPFQFYPSTPETLQKDRADALAFAASRAELNWSENGTPDFWGQRLEMTPHPPFGRLITDRTPLADAERAFHRAKDSAVF
jgi:hypothetical protein